MHIHRTLILSACFFLASSVLTPLALADPVSYEITVNTMPVSTTYGYIDMQFNPSTPPTQMATATVSDFLTDGVLNPADPNNGITGDASGALGPTTTVSFDNGTITNEYVEGLTYGTTISFELTLDGDMIEHPDNAGGGTTFYLGFTDSSGNPVLTSDPSGQVGYVTINNNGSTQATELSSDVTITPLTPTPSIPEPSTWLLLGMGLVGVVAVVRKRRHETSTVAES